MTSLPSLQKTLNVFNKLRFVFLKQGEFVKCLIHGLNIGNFPDCEGIDCKLPAVVCKYKVLEVFVWMGMNFLQCAWFINTNIL